MFFFFDEIKDFVETSSYQKLSLELNALRIEYPKITLGTMATFFSIVHIKYVNFGREMSLREISKEIGMPYPTFSRQTDILSDVIDGESMGLLKKVQMKNSRKLKTVVLSDHGRRFVLRFRDILDTSDMPRRDLPISS